ncbi:MAG: hypothetical protein QXI12_12310 [Candidatus Methanomethyliaceae archaeon]
MTARMRKTFGDLALGEVFYLDNDPEVGQRAYKVSPTEAYVIPLGHLHSGRRAIAPEECFEVTGERVIVTMVNDAPGAAQECVADLEEAIEAAQEVLNLDF